MANNPSDLIQFKRGSMANLETLMTNKGGIDGTFYLTIDDDATDTNTPSHSSRLFVGRPDGSIVPVNQGIITVSAVNDLTNNIAGKWHAGDYAYVTGDNILAIYDGQRWKQINQVGTDTYVSSITDNVTTTGGVVTVETDALMNDGATHRKDSFTLTGDKGISVSSSGKDITITGDEYTLSSDVVANSNTATITLASDNVADAGTITVNKTGDITITGGTDEITIGVVDRKVNSATLSNEQNGFGLIITRADGVSTTKTTVNPVITYGENGTETANFQNGTATLDVYSKDEVDKLKQEFDAMTYCGTVGTGGSASQVGIDGISSAHVGDTFKASSDFTLLSTRASDNAEHAIKTGDLLIAVGTEDPTTGLITGTIKFDVVPSGNDYDTTYTVTSKSHGINIVSSRGPAIGSIALASGSEGLIELDDGSTTTNKTVTVSHAAVTTTATTGTAETQNNNASFTTNVISGVTTDGYGHVTEVTTKSITVKDTNASLTSVTEAVAAGTGNAANKEATITTTAVLTHANGATVDTKSDSFKIASQNLKIEADATNKVVTANFVWGQF